MANAKDIQQVMAQLLLRRGIGQERQGNQWSEVWSQAAGNLGVYSRPGSVRRGTLEVLVANSTVLQELSLRKADLVAELQRLRPEAGVLDLKFRVGAVSDSNH